MHLRCPHCQNPIEIADIPSAGQISCTGCGSTFNFDPHATASQTTKAEKLGKFEILDLLGEGAFGSVFKARDAELDRTVAIKVPRIGNVGSGPQDVDRFLREARAVARLRFPSIISIYEVGIHEGRPYLVCDFVEGLTLADVLTGRRLTFHEAAKLIADVADALQYAHSLGVVHRDVKPSNIMIRPDGSPCVMDFGLAKREAGEITMTMDGHILGTPAYMSPEQARGQSHQVDGRSDVYSLGVMLYQLLTHELPFRGNKAMLLHQVLHDEPQPPRSLNHKIPRDLETIALKAMAKEPERRYASAKELAEDLRRWLSGEPIVARPVGVIERTWRWAKRRPALATANLAVMLAMTVFMIAFFVVSDARDQAIDFGKKEEDQRKKAEKLAKDNDLLATEQSALAKANKKLAEESAERREQAETLALRVQYEHYFSKIEDHSDPSLVRMASLLPKAVWLKDQSLASSLRLQVGAWSGRETQLRGVCQHRAAILAVALSLDGKTALTGSADHTARLWETATGNPIGPPLLHQDAIWRVALSADGKMALTGSRDKTARLWDAVTAKPIGAPLVHGGEIDAVAISTDGKIALTGSYDKTARLWNTVTGKPIGPPLQHQAAVRTVALSGDGAVALTGSDDKTSQVWDTATGKPIGPPLNHQERVDVVALSVNGKIALTGSADHTARLWESATGKPIGPPLQHQGWVNAVALSADGKVAITGSDDKMAQVWDVTTGTPIGLSMNHQGEVKSVAISADGKTALTAAGGDHAARLWETATGKPIGPPLQHQASVTAVALSADGKYAFTGSIDKSARVWEASHLKPRLPSLQHQGNVIRLSLSADSKTALTLSFEMQGSERSSARLWNTATGKPIGPPLRHQGSVMAAVLSSDGKIAFTAGGNEARLWEAATRKLIGQPLVHRQVSLHSVALSADRKKALTGCGGKTTQLWDVITGTPIGPPVPHQDWVDDLALSADGKIAMTAIGKTAQLWETATWKPIGSPLWHQAEVNALALSADGKTALTGGTDKTVRIWDTTASRPIGPPLQHKNGINSLALSSDGKRALTGMGDNTAVLWETATCKPIGPPLVHEDLVQAVALSADGNTALTGDAQIARVWRMPQPMRGDPERIMLWTQVITGLEVDDLAAVRVLDTATWHQRRQRLQELGGPPILD